MPKDPEPMSLANLIVLGKLGRGSTSHVFRAQSTKDKQLYAMKVFDKKSSQYRSSALEKELQIHRQLKHRHVVCLKAHIEDSDNHYVLTEYCDGGEVTGLLKDTLTEQLLAQITLEVALGLQYLHSRGIAHCDLKLSNLLLQGRIIKICDFGFSRRIQPAAQGPLCGTILYMAPQILREGKRTFFREADIWALGICILILLTKKQPYLGEDHKTIAKQILAGKRIPLTRNISPQLKDLLDRIFQEDPLKRITLKDILQHPFVAQRKDERQGEIQVKEKKITKSISETSLAKNRKEEEAGLEGCMELPFQNQNEEERGKEGVLWEFKRKKKKDSKDDFTQKKNTIKVGTDQNATVKTKKSQNIPAVQMPSKMLEGKSGKEKGEGSLKTLDVRLISPLKEFSYETKNDGFIKIAPSGDVSIKVKEVVFEITDQGKTIRLNNKTYRFEEIAQGSKQLAHVFEYYCYALKVTDIFKSKKLHSEHLLQFRGEEVLLGLNKQRTKALAIAPLRQGRVVIECTLESGDTKYQLQGQEEAHYGQKQGQLFEIKQLVEFVKARAAQI